MQTCKAFFLAQAWHLRLIDDISHENSMLCANEIHIMTVLSKKSKYDFLAVNFLSAIESSQ